jgi:hypothetical protein
MLLDKKILVKRNARELDYGIVCCRSVALYYWRDGGKASFALELNGGKLTHRAKGESW